MCGGFKPGRPGPSLPINLICSYDPAINELAAHTYGSFREAPWSTRIRQHKGGINSGPEQRPSFHPAPWRSLWSLGRTGLHIAPHEPQATCESHLKAQLKTCTGPHGRCKITSGRFGGPLRSLLVVAPLVLYKPGQRKKAAFFSFHYFQNPKMRTNPKTPFFLFRIRTHTCFFNSRVLIPY